MVARKLALIAFFMWAGAGPAVAGDPGAAAVRTGASWRELAPEEIVTADGLRKEQLANPDLLIFDARSLKEFQTAHITGAILPLPVDFYRALGAYRRGESADAPDQAAALAKNFSGYAKDRPIVAYCNVDCKASAGLLLKLKNMGFTNVRAMEEGIQVWMEKGYPVTLGVEGLSIRDSEGKTVTQ